MRNFKILWICLLLLAVGCGENEEITPSANFLVQGIVDVQEELLFNNQSKNATEYFWDFGDGKFSNEESPKHTYQEAGDFQVILEASDGINITVYDTIITIKERYLSEIWFQSSAKELPESVFLFFGESDNEENFFIFRLPNGLSNGDLPLGGSSPLGGNLLLNDSEWFLMLVANNPPFDEFDSGDELIVSSSFNAASTKGDGPAEGRYIKITDMIDQNAEPNTFYDFRLGYEIRDVGYTTKED